MAATRERLHQLGVDTLVIVGSDPERARFYLRHRPSKVPVAADPGRITHRAYGLPNPPLTLELEETLKAMRVEIEKTAVSANDLAELRSAAQKIEATPIARTSFSITFPS